MDDRQIWQAIDDERARTAQMLDQLTEEEWRRPSLCEGWTVRVVAAHLTLAPHTTPGRAVKEIVKARGSFHRMVDRTSRRSAERPVDEIVADLRGIVGNRKLAPGQKLEDALMDLLVHTQDIAIPLRKDHHMPVEAAVTAAERLWQMGFPFHTKKKMAGRRLVATDADWAAGEGTEVSGPVEALVMLMAGRTATIPRLSGITA